MIIDYHVYAAAPERFKFSVYIVALMDVNSPNMSRYVLGHPESGSDSLVDVFDMQ